MIYFGTVVHVNDKKSIRFMKAGGGGERGRRSHYTGTLLSCVM